MGCAYAQPIASERGHSASSEAPERGNNFGYITICAPGHPAAHSGDRTRMLSEKDRVSGCRVFPEGTQARILHSIACVDFLWHLYDADHPGDQPRTVGVLFSHGAHAVRHRHADGGDTVSRPPQARRRDPERLPLQFQHHRHLPFRRSRLRGRPVHRCCARSGACSSPCWRCCP